MHDLEIARPDLVVIRTGEKTCPECAPTSVARSAEAKSAFVKASWVVTDDRQPQWQVWRDKGDGDVDYVPVGPPDVDPEPGGVDPAAWRDFARDLGDTDFKLLKQRWRPDHCAAIDELAAALDVMWSLVGSSGRIVVRLAGLSSTVVAAVTQAVTAASASDALLPIATLGRSLRALGTLACASTADIASCLSARRLFGTLPATPEPGIAEVLAGPYMVDALTRMIAALPVSEMAPPPVLPAGKMPTEPLSQPAETLRMIEVGTSGPPAGPAVFGTQP
ncbi:hypothetical protein [Kutzneria kofuensis]|uniref:Uncharacterized protein n=1 Tax=Kutzneria kofuensis TaxID=103725 RepID=A0A7W9KQQ4_9PSEU|nr:hypothetical protein [Kutzneria kofuensis]MBB5896688.1 hypothetical protein [Kutzneria kofuensis]